jgi:hypothetical protein
VNVLKYLKLLKNIKLILQVFKNMDSTYAELRNVFHRLKHSNGRLAEGKVGPKKLPRLSKPADDRRGRRIRGEVWAYPSGGLV